MLSSSRIADIDPGSGTDSDRSTARHYCSTAARRHFGSIAAVHLSCSKCLDCIHSNSAAATVDLALSSRSCCTAVATVDSRSDLDPGIKSQLPLCLVLRTLRCIIDCNPNCIRSIGRPHPCSTVTIEVNPL